MSPPDVNNATRRQKSERQGRWEEVALLIDINGRREGIAHNDHSDILK